MPPYPSPVTTWHAFSYAKISPFLPHLSTTGKNILITGGGSGIGSSIVHSFAKSGATRISILGRREEPLLQTKLRIEKEFPRTKVFSHVADLLDRDAVAKAFEAVKASVGVIDVLVANAGYSPKLASLEDSNPSEWWDAFEVNVKGNMNLIQAFLPVASKTASVLNVTAGAIHFPYLPGFSGYAASKLAATKMFDYLRCERPELFVLHFHPGLIRTGIQGNPNALGFDDGEYIRPICNMQSRRRVFEADSLLCSSTSGGFCSGELGCSKA